MDTDDTTADDTTDMVLALERAVWNALVTGDTAADERLLAADFLGVYPSGFADRSDHVAQLIDGPTVAEFTISDAHTISITEDDVLLSYDARYRRPDTDVDERMFVSSLWSRRDGRWVNTFSQDTPADVGDTEPEPTG